jgi:hypothetical protein
MRRPIYASKLVNLLGSWDPAVKLTRQDFAEPLGVGFGMGDCLALHAALQTMPAADTAAPVGTEPQLLGDCERVQAMLVAAAKRLLEPLDDDGSPPSFSPYHQRYLDWQRLVAVHIDPLCLRARELLCSVSPEMAQLAALDAVLGEALAVREQKAWNTVAQLLARRFEQHGLAHVDDAGDGPPEASLSAFRGDMHALALAELDARMQVARGLAASVDSSFTSTQ